MSPRLSRSIFSGLIAGVIYIVIELLAGHGFGNAFGFALVLAILTAVLAYAASTLVGKNVLGGSSRSILSGAIAGIVYLVIVLMNGAAFFGAIGYALVLAIGTAVLTLLAIKLIGRERT